MNFKNSLSLCLFPLFLVGCEKREEIQKSLHVEPKASQIAVDTKSLQKELNEIDTNSYLEAYIIHIINNGSNGILGFSGGVMEGGIATKEDAPNIARFVMSLSGKQSSDDNAGKKAELFYTSNCGGCHGNDGKGLNGAFPDLTQKSFRGIEKRKAYLKSNLD